MNNRSDESTKTAFDRDGIMLEVIQNEIKRVSKESENHNIDWEYLKALRNMHIAISDEITFHQNKQQACNESPRVNAHIKDNGKSPNRMTSIIFLILASSSLIIFAFLSPKIELDDPRFKYASYSMSFELTHPSLNFDPTIYNRKFDLYNSANLIDSIVFTTTTIKLMHNIDSSVIPEDIGSMKTMVDLIGEYNVRRNYKKPNPEFYP